MGLRRFSPSSYRFSICRVAVAFRSGFFRQSSIFCLVAAKALASDVASKVIRLRLCACACRLSCHTHASAQAFSRRRRCECFSLKRGWRLHSAWECSRRYQRMSRLVQERYRPPTPLCGGNDVYDDTRAFAHVLSRSFSFIAFVSRALSNLLELYLFVVEFVQHRDTNLKWWSRSRLIRASPAFFCDVQGIGWCLVFCSSHVVLLLRICDAQSCILCDYMLFPFNALHTQTSAVHLHI